MRDVGGIVEADALFPVFGGEDFGFGEGLPLSEVVLMLGELMEGLKIEGLVSSFSSSSKPAALAAADETRVFDNEVRGLEALEVFLGLKGWCLRLWMRWERALGVTPSPNFSARAL